LIVLEPVLCAAGIDTFPICEVAYPDSAFHQQQQQQVADKVRTMSNAVLVATTGVVGTTSVATDCHADPPTADAALAARLYPLLL